MSAARSSTGISGVAVPRWSRCALTHWFSRLRRLSRAGPSRRVRYGATDSPGARRRIRMTMARSSMVSGIAPIPARAAMANVWVRSTLELAALYLRAVNASPSAVYRSIGDEDEEPAHDPAR